MADRHRIAIVGVGKIARDQHLPALARDARFAVIAAADPRASLDGVPCFPSLDALLADGPLLDAVSICTPPGGRGTLVARAIEAGLHVMLEKPPAATLSEIRALEAQARARGVTMFTTWHSREAGAVAPARTWLSERRLDGFAIRWKEDIRRWHPGQDWILGSGGFGVFDPGINALSIATAVLPAPLLVTGATFEVPEGRQSPIAAALTLACGAASGTAELDFLRAGEQQWDVEFRAGDETLLIREGGRALVADGSSRSFPNEEYARLYDRFARLVEQGASDVDARPSELVADAFVIATRRQVAAFNW